MSGFADRRTAFVGLGAMGLPIAVRLAAVLPGLAVSDLANERVNEVVSTAPATVAEPQAIRSADCVFLCLPTQDTTRAVIEELLTESTPSRTVIDLGAQAPSSVTATADFCASRSAAFCDAPVFGTPSMAGRGDLYFLFSGPTPIGRDFTRLFESVGYRARIAGETAGTASTIKLLQNALGTANLLAGAEALRVCEATGIETGTFIDVVRECGGIGLSSVFDRFAEDMALRRDSGEGRLRIAAKDARAVADIATGHATAAPLLQQVAEQFDSAIEAGMGEQQWSSIIDLFQSNRSA